MATLDIKYLCNPTDGTPGPAFDAFEVDAMNAASKGDKRGYSVADTWLGIDEGGTDPTAPALPPGATAMAVEAQNCRRSRQKNAYQFLVTHCLDKDHTAHMKREFFGDGFAAVYIHDSVIAEESDHNSMSMTMIQYISNCSFSFSIHVQTDHAHPQAQAPSRLGSALPY